MLAIKGNVITSIRNKLLLRKRQDRMENRHAMNWGEIFPQHLSQRTCYMLLIPTNQEFQKWSKYLTRHLSKKISKRHIVT